MVKQLLSHMEGDVSGGNQTEEHNYIGKVVTTIEINQENCQVCLSSLFLCIFWEISHGSSSLFLSCFYC
ncbi:BnaCnng72720D [Brassica napus]|uniref:BnaCnng72720D protein n=2 Tax=Brassica TaxID=3705 RepID=A0A078JYC2_BRANA|nr:BnaCnng72720D [Brassica napus]